MATVFTSARSHYRDSFAIPDTNGVLYSLSDIQVYVLKKGGVFSNVGDRINVYNSRSPSNVTPLAQPLTTPSTGAIDFWAEPGEYDLFFHDSQIPARVADQTIGWSAVSTDDYVNITPLGTVIEWWRPSSSFDAGAGPGNPPPGYEVALGQTITNGNHGFGSFDIVLPDLRNKVTFGADPYKADGAASVAGSGSAAWNAQHPNAPGIRGVGGSNNIHSHVIPGHYHGVSDPGHAHSVADAYHNHGGATTAPSDGRAHWDPGFSGIFSGEANNTYGNPGYVSSRFIEASSHTHYIASSLTGIGIYSNATGIKVGNQAGVLGDYNQNSSSVDTRPQHVGLLKCIKVRWR